MKTSDFGDRLPEYIEQLNRALERWLPAASQHPQRMHQAMRYSVLGGGKHFRPLLIYATGETLGLPASQLDGLAAAVEIIHAYSLVHDDLPAMDDDDLRRGQPSCHRQFDEATAILAGDALQALAFHVLATDTALTPNPTRRLQVIQAIAEAIGSRGMAGGQAVDLEAAGRTLTHAELESMHIHKTGALIRACVVGACYCKTDLDNLELERLDRFGKCIGLAYQIQDDILDEIGETSELGETSGADRARAKPTYPSTLGLSESKRLSAELIQDANSSLAAFGERAAPLRWLADFVISRHR